MFTGQQAAKYSHSSGFHETDMTQKETSHDFEWDPLDNTTLLPWCVRVVSAQSVHVRLRSDVHLHTIVHMDGNDRQGF